MDPKDSYNTTKFQPYYIGIILIWIVMVFPGMIIYAVYQARPSLKESLLLREIGPYTALALMSNSIWETIATLIAPPMHISWLGYDCILTIILTFFICLPLMKVMVLTFRLLILLHLVANTYVASFLLVFLPAGQHVLHSSIFHQLYWNWVQTTSKLRTQKLRECLSILLS